MIPNTSYVFDVCRSLPVRHAHRNGTVPGHHLVHDVLLLGANGVLVALVDLLDVGTAQVLVLMASNEWRLRTDCQQFSMIPRKLCVEQANGDWHPVGT